VFLLRNENTTAVANIAAMSTKQHGGAKN